MKLRFLFQKLPGAPLSRTAFAGVGFRFAAVNYADSVNFINGLGASKYGGRFTPISGAPTVYLALDKITAVAELESYFRYYNLPDTSFKPRVFAAVQVNCKALLDLREPKLLQMLGLTLDHIQEEWRPDNDDGRTAGVQRFGQIVAEVGYEGILFSSARAAGDNLALFPKNFAPGTTAAMIQ
jgi:RES domain-containing protein